MKKSVIIAALGLAVSAVSSFGQGSIIFNSYLANGSVGIQTFFSGINGNAPVGAGFTADLLWSLSPITDATSGNGALTPGWNFSGGGNGSINNVAVAFGTTATTLGYFQGTQNFALSTYTAGTPIFFEIIAYQTGLTYATSNDRGHSASFSTTLATGINSPTEVSFAPFTVSAVVPEPTTLALAGLGGLAALFGFRRKNA